MRNDWPYAHIMCMATKIFSSSRMSFLPRDWYTAVGGTHHSCQGYLVVVAHVKSDVPALFADRGVHQRTADELTRSVTLLSRNRTMPNSIEAIVESGIADFDVPGVYAYKDPVHGHVIVKVQPGTGECVEIGRFVYEKGTFRVENI